ncbi:MAG: DNA-primase RepB domain-containing protein [bacterium]|nr:DNA-primase RepB domain-containing protein [bacterium]
MPCFEGAGLLQPFFYHLYHHCIQPPDACLTLTAIHPAGDRPTPSRHIPLSDNNALRTALAALQRANVQGWGAYFAVGLRRTELTRWQRGGLADVVALPALFVDVDDPSDIALQRLEAMSPVPSCIVFSGGGYHAYWWLEEPLSDMGKARELLQELALRTGGDRLSPAQSLRLPNTINSKPGRDGRQCEIKRLTEARYPLNAFPPVTPIQRREPCSATRRTTSTRFVPSPALMDAVVQTFAGQGYRPAAEWLKGRCPFPERHKHGDQHASFAFNTRTGYGYCHVCGTLLLKDLCPVLGIVPS